MILATVGLKGGVGKSTVAVHLAGALAGCSRPVLLVDADPQGTLTEWAGVRRDQPAHRLLHAGLAVSPSTWAAQNILTRLQDAAARFDVTIVDCGPASETVTRAALTVAAVAILPVTPSPFDLRAVRRTVEVIRQRQEAQGSGIEVRLLVSRAIVGTTLARDVPGELRTFGLPVFRTEIAQRVALAEAGIVGLTIQEYAPASIAAQEFASLGREVSRWQRRE